MIRYVNEVQRQLIAVYGFPAKPGHPTLPDDGVPDGTYPMIIDGRLDFTRIVDGGFVLAQPATPADVEEARGFVADRFNEMRKAGNDTAAHELNLLWMRLAPVYHCINAECGGAWAGQGDACPNGCDETPEPAGYTLDEASAPARTAIPLLAHRRTDKGSGVVLDLREVGGGFMWALFTPIGVPWSVAGHTSIAKATAAMIEAGERLGWWGVSDV